MNRPVPLLKILVAMLPMLGLGACATAQKWSSSGGDREQGVVRLSYKYPEFHQPTMSDAQAAVLALNRCNSWGYRKAEPIAGQVRQCANTDDGNCDLWMVTREFQCTDGAASFASRLSR
jgi:YecR-like lipoprotein